MGVFFGKENQQEISVRKTRKGLVGDLMVFFSLCLIVLLIGSLLFSV